MTVVPGSRQQLIQLVEDFRQSPDADPGQLLDELRTAMVQDGVMDIETLVAAQYSALADALDGFQGAIAEFRDLGAEADDLAARVRQAQRRFTIELSAQLDDEGYPSDTPTGEAVSTSFRRFTGILSGLGESMGELVEQTIRDSHSRKELELAGMVQHMLVPPSTEVCHGGFRVFSWFAPALQCAGDWWSCTSLGGDDALLVIGDVTGHGAASAILTGMMKGACDLARMGMRDSLRPYQLMRMLNRVLSTSVCGEYMMTAAGLRLWAEKRELAVTSAGHRAFWHCRGGDLRLVRSAPEPPLGADPRHRYGEMKLPVASGDILVLFTDGIPECEDHQGAQLGERRIRDAIQASVGDGPEAVRDAIQQLVHTHRGDRSQADDSTLVVAEITL